MLTLKKIIYSLHLIYIIIVTISVATPITAQQTIIWSLAGNGFWDKATNWTPPQVPTAIDTVIIEHDSVLIPNNVHAQAAQVFVGIASSSVPTGLGILANGSLTISGAVDDGLTVAGNNTTLLNNGVLNIQNIAVHAIQIREGLFNNSASGTINIGPAIGAWGIYNLSAATFENNGSVLINDTYGDAIHSTSVFRNHGLIDVYDAGDDGIHSTVDTFFNFDTIRIKLVNNKGIFNRGSFTNETTGLITVDSAGTGFESDSYLDNLGIICISNCIRGMQNNSLLSNTDSIQVYNCGSGILNTGDLHNESMGVIIIDSSSTFGGLEVSDTIENHGEIHISRTKSTALFNTGYFLNNGKLAIENVHNGHGISNCEIIVSNGGCDITNVAGTGIQTSEAGSSFVNRDTIDIRNTQVGFTVVEGSVINEGSILTLNSELQAIKVTAGAHLTNTGEMSTAESGKGLDVSEDGFIFHQSGMICLSGKDIGLHISDGGTIDIASPADLFVRSNVGEPLVIELGGEFNCLGTLTAEHFIN